MKNLLVTTALVGLTASAVNAAGVERSPLSTGILFEDGDYMELSFGLVSPSVSGTQTGTLTTPFGTFPAAGQASGDVAGDYSTLAFSYKNQISDDISIGLIIDQPIGADTFYKPTTTVPPFAYGFGPGSTAKLDSIAVTGLVKYQMQNNVSVFGGLRALRTSGDVALFSGYTLNTSTETDLGYVLGVAWEKPEIAARVALTYNSEISHDFTGTEAFTAAGIPEGPTAFTTAALPQSLNLEFQTGVAADTLVFGSVRWVDWTSFLLQPPVYDGVLGLPLVSYEDDRITYNIGVGRRFNDEWSGALLASYEPSTGSFAGNLGPTDGLASVGVAVTRSFETVEVTAGARYIWIGDAETENPFAPGTALNDFSGNSGWAAGVRVGYSF